MPYLLCLLNNQLTPEELEKFLCYYTNITEEIHTIKVIDQDICYLNFFVFPSERILFSAL